MPGDRHGEGMALGNLSIALRDVRRFEEAIIACQDAAAIYRETGDQHSEREALGNSKEPRPLSGPEAAETWPSHLVVVAVQQSG